MEDSFKLKFSLQFYIGKMIFAPPFSVFASLAKFAMIKTPTKILPQD
jgi:hypothetical protein